MNRRNICILTGILCVAGSIFGLDTVFGMGWFGAGRIKEPLESFEYSRGGGMLGAHKGLKVDRLEQGSALIIKKESKWHGEDVKISEYKVSDKVLADIQTIFNNYKMARCVKAPMSKFQVLDGDTSSYYFKFSEQSIKFSSSQNIPTDTYKGIREMLACVEKYSKEGTKLPGLEAPVYTEKNFTEKQAPTDGKISLEPYGYSIKGLSFRIKNGTAEEKSIFKNCHLYKLTPEPVLLEEQISKYPSTLYAHNSSEEFLRLKQRLEAGRYRLKVAEYETEFEIK